MKESKILNIETPFTKHTFLDLLDFEEKASRNENEPSLIKGYASTFGNIDRHGDAMMKGCFSNTIEKTGGMWPILLNHKDNIGLNEKAKETAKGLYIESKIFDHEKDILKAREAVALVRASAKMGHKMGLSIGGIVKKIKFVHCKDEKSYFEILDFEVMEHSITPVPANEMAQITQVKQVHSTVQKSYLGFMSDRKSRFSKKEEEILLFIEKYISNLR